MRSTVAFKCFCRFSFLPLLMLSSTRTSAPRSTNASTRCEPIKEAPPVTKTRFCLQFIRSTSLKNAFYAKDCEETNQHLQVKSVFRSEERRVGKECRCRWSREH